MSRPNIFYNNPNNNWNNQQPVSQFQNNLPPASQYQNNLPPAPTPVWDPNSRAWVLPQPQFQQPPPPPVPVWDPNSRAWVLPQPNITPAYNAQVGSNFTQYQQPQYQQSQPSNNLQSSTLSKLAVESVMRESDHLPASRLYDLNPTNFNFVPPTQDQTSNFNNFNSGVGAVQPEMQEVKPPKKVYVNIGLVDSRKETVMPINEEELALELYTFTSNLTEPTLIEVNNIKRVMYDGTCFTADTQKETVANLKAKLHEFTAVTSVLQIIKLVGELRDDYEAKYIADLICSKVKNIVELAMIHRYGDDSYKSLPYIEFYETVGDLFIALGIKDDMDRCVIRMVANLFTTMELIPYDKSPDALAQVDDLEIKRLTDELGKSIPKNNTNNVDLIVLDVPVNTIVLPWVTSYTHSTNKITVRVGEEVLNDLFHQAFSVLPTETLFIDVYDNMHKRYRVYRHGPKMLTPSTYHIDKFIE